MKGVELANVILAALLTAVTAASLFVSFKTAGINERAAESSRQASEAARESVAVARSSVDEMRRQRLVATLPLLVVEEAKLSWYGERLDYVELKVRNVGEGFAYGLLVSIAVDSMELSSRAVPGPIVSGGRALASLSCPKEVRHIGGRLALDITTQCSDVYGEKRAWRQEALIVSGKTNPESIGAPGPVDVDSDDRDRGI